jgi:excisionase family DNA binding protein
MMAKAPNTGTGTALPQLLLIPEVAAVARVEVSTVRYWLYRKLIPSRKPGRRRLIARADLERFLGVSLGDGNE